MAGRAFQRRCSVLLATGAGCILHLACPAVFLTRALQARSSSIVVQSRLARHARCSRRAAASESDSSALVFWSLDSGAGLQRLEQHLELNDYLGGTLGATVNDLFVLEQIPDYDLLHYNFRRVHEWRLRVLSEIPAIDRSEAVTVDVRRHSPEHEAYLRKSIKSPKPTNSEPVADSQKNPEEPAQVESSSSIEQITNPVYHTDSYLFRLDNCKVVDFAESSDETAQDGQKPFNVVLDRTIFHPQGGGQPGDKGTITAQVEGESRGLAPLAINRVSLQAGGAVVHNCLVDASDAEAWQAAINDGIAIVCCNVDEIWRRESARLHSAGHLIDAAVDAAGCKWIAGKGYHFPDGPSVEYKVGPESRQIDMGNGEEKDAILKELQAGVDLLTVGAAPVRVSYKDDVRYVEMGGVECPCGGTHVKDTSEIGQIVITKIKKKKGNIKISYSVKASAK
eukprot:TRINITY_DN12369_c0_g2_i1.p1 TRINITY_DN12369_c0_g2~~TRINITY_DN12369_c0_g2_i1.p1  ORF type:complete len:451 (+),score=83.80 TRINITY_DN12369_c0_g2_i1:175-1527(+)